MTPVLLDISRLIWRVRRRSPTGIDRVELEYAQELVAAQRRRPGYAVLHLCGFLLVFSPAGSRRFIEDVATRWRGTAPAQPGNAALFGIYWRLFRAWLAGPRLGRLLSRHDRPPVFLVVSHHHVPDSYAFARIRHSLGARTVCLIHDLIPLEYPEYFKPGWERRYRRLASNLDHSFDGVIANSGHTALVLRAKLEGISRARVRVCHAPLGVRTFPRPATLADLDRPHFAVLGTIEPRKNHLLLLNLWTRLAARPPRLYIIGSRGWENEQVVDMLERSHRLRGAVQECGGVSDAEVGAILCQARALLLPSFAEGFGLPLAEALASGVPVICSDIPPFRELGRDVPEYLDPMDLPAWLNMVAAYSQPGAPRRAAQLERLANWRAPSWSDHFEAVEGLLQELAGEGTPAITPSAVPAADVRIRQQPARR
ncbi:MAG TPA: glycosyltransferase family 1 protein [Steroidobacteraceae bacterium]|nr:glycosyltransferase family 1 protein [Steroidobacteraceae bacterium]